MFDQQIWREREKHNTNYRTIEKVALFCESKLSNRCVIFPWVTNEKDDLPWICGCHGSRYMSDERLVKPKKPCAISEYAHKLKISKQIANAISFFLYFRSHSREYHWLAQSPPTDRVYRDAHAIYWTTPQFRFAIVCSICWWLHCWVWMADAYFFYQTLKFRH